VRGIAAGERWKAALQKAAHRCEVVLALVSPQWLASQWCKTETDAARLMGKRVIVALIGADKAQIPLDLTDEQWVDLANDPNGFTRLKEGLRRIGLDPSAFPFERGRRPYPGFAALEEKDAAIFFGRDAQIVRGLDKMRGLARTGVDRMLVILGASGAGKSSFLRAGLWPRLKRDDRTWLPLPTIRPERAILSGKFGLAQSLHRIMSAAPFDNYCRERGLPRSRIDVHEFILASDDGLPKILAALRDAARAPSLAGETVPPPTIVIPIDQGEELFNEDGRGEAQRFVDILTRTLRADGHALALLAMRTDAFPQLQTDPLLADLPKDTFTLDMMLEGSYRAVIEGPAKLVEPQPLKIDPQLTDALLEDVSGQDALPLLAFSLRHLYEGYSADGKLTLAEYEKLRRLKGVIATTVAEAIADGVAKGELPRDAKAQRALVRMAFIPHLARVNAGGQFVRRVATRSEIPAAARPLVDRFAEHRLLIKDRREIHQQDQEVIEVAHEALLREWRELNEALEEEREFLVAKGQLEHDLGEWRAALDGRKKRGLLRRFLDRTVITFGIHPKNLSAQERRFRGALLSGNRLGRAREWLVSRPEDPSPDERQFIQNSVYYEATDRRQIKWLNTMLFASILVFTITAAFMSLYLVSRSLADAGYALLRRGQADFESGDAASTAKNFELAEKQYTEAIANFRAAAELGDPKAGNWLWLAKLRLADQKSHAGAFAEAILISLPNYLDLTDETLSSINPVKLKSKIRSLSSPLAMLHAQLVTGRNPNAPVNDCDHLASHTQDPLRVAEGVPFDRIDATAAIAACTAAIETDGKVPRFLLQRARAYAKAADVARQSKDEALASQHDVAKLADLNVAMAQGYPIAFDDMAGAYERGEGVEKDKAKAADLTLQTFNRVVACCATRVARHLLEVEEKHDPENVRRVVRELLTRAAALADRSAHELLAELTDPGTLAPAYPARIATGKADFTTAPRWLKPLPPSSGGDMIRSLSAAGVAIVRMLGSAPLFAR
jgi:hypothetical protein